MRFKSTPKTEKIKLFRIALLASALIACTKFSVADIKITLDPMDGSSVSDIVKIAARVESVADIDRVEFKLDQKEVIISRSVPYQFVWDTIKDTEGQHSLAITAFDSKGESKLITAAFKVDNDLNLGGDALAAKAKSAHEQGKEEDAVRYIRRALKAAPGNLTASLLSAEIAASVSDWNQAAGTLEKADGLEKSAEALHKLSTYKIMQALMPQNSAQLEEGLAAAVDYRRKSEALNVDMVRQKYSDSSVASCIVNGDALLQAGRFSEAAVVYMKPGDPLSVPTSLTARLGLAFTLDNRPEETFTLFRPLFRAKMNDTAIDTVQGLTLLRTGQFEASRAAISKALLEHVPGAEIVSSLISLTEGKKSLANGEALSASAKLGESADAAYAVAITSTDPHIADSSLINAMTLSPLQPGPYLEMATRILQQKRPDKFDQAYQLIELSLSLDKENIRAKLMRTLLLLEQNKINIAESVIADLTKKKINTPDYLATLAVYWNVKHNPEFANRSMAAARKLDAVHFSFDLPGTPLDLLNILNRKIHYRTGAFLGTSSLFTH